MAFCTLKPEPPTTQAPKYGKMSPTIPNLTSGPWDALSMKWLRSSHRSRPKICRGWWNLLLWGCIHLSILNIRKNWGILSRWCCSRKRSLGHLLRNCSLLIWCRRRSKSWKCKERRWWKRPNQNYLRPSAYRRNCIIWPIVSLSQITIIYQTQANRQNSVPSCKKAKKVACQNWTESSNPASPPKQATKEKNAVRSVTTAWWSKVDQR